MVIIILSVFLSWWTHNFEHTDTGLQSSVSVISTPAKTHAYVSVGYTGSAYVIILYSLNEYSIWRGAWFGSHSAFDHAPHIVSTSCTHWWSIAFSPIMVWLFISPDHCIMFTFPFCNEVNTSIFNEYMTHYPSILSPPKLPSPASCSHQDWSTNTLHNCTYICYVASVDGLVRQSVWWGHWDNVIDPLTVQQQGLYGKSPDSIVHGKPEDRDAKV